MSIKNITVTNEDGTTEVFTAGVDVTPVKIIVPLNTPIELVADTSTPSATVTETPSSN